MRIWTVHPKYLDSKGIVALWREALLAQKVLQGLTKGYKNHPQLLRFKAYTDPIAAITSYLITVHEESLLRGYQFDRSKIADTVSVVRMDETEGQLFYEWGHLRQKLQRRDQKRFSEVQNLRKPEAHPMFHIVAGGVRSWERKKSITV